MRFNLKVPKALDYMIGVPPPCVSNYSKTREGNREFSKALFDLWASFAFTEVQKYHAAGAKLGVRGEYFYAAIANERVDWVDSPEIEPQQTVEWINDLAERLMEYRENKEATPIEGLYGFREYFDMSKVDFETIEDIMAPRLVKLIQDDIEYRKFAESVLKESEPK